ncbi:MAG: hypothetical protein IPH74_11735 [Bacteroidetes bacterium]|nr:hypothetical protein [Bacteroidota bacterium]
MPIRCYVQLVRCCIDGNLLFSGSTFTTPTLNSNTTYYVESENGSAAKALEHQ